PTYSTIARQRSSSPRCVSRSMSLWKNSIVGGDHTGSRGETETRSSPSGLTLPKTRIRLCDMPNRSKEVDAHITKAPPFAKPILRKIREMFHRGCPELTEVLKWRMPFFDYKGTLGGMATFKNYVRMGFWKGKLIEERLGLPVGKSVPRMMSVQITSVDQLLDD